MAHTHSCLLVHVVFSTRERRPWLDDDHLRADLHAYLGGIARELDATALAINGTADHVHLLLSLSPRHAVAEVVRELKTRSTAWLHRTRPQTHAGFGWQTGYGVFSVSRSGQGKVVAYLAGQEKHHRKQSFADELLGLLRRHGVAYDESGSCLGKTTPIFLSTPAGVLRSFYSQTPGWHPGLLSRVAPAGAADVLLLTQG